MMIMQCIYRFLQYPLYYEGMELQPTVKKLRRLSKLPRYNGHGAECIAPSSLTKQMLNYLVRGYAGELHCKIYMLPNRAVILMQHSN